jgi:hypothetical protein
MNPIEVENQNEGTMSWHNTSASLNVHRRSVDVEGYCSKNSVMAGETLAFHVSSTTPFVIDLYRMGFYGGAGARHMHQTEVISTGKHEDPPIGEMQLRDCDWPESHRFTIPHDWLSGVYLGKLTQVETSAPTQSYVIFIVRDRRQCDFLFKTSDLTWCAYNAWPDEYSLYEMHGPSAKVGYWGPGLQVSFDRPYAMGLPWYGMYEPERCAWMVGASQFLIFEYPLLFWMESRGYDVSYISCMDLHLMPSMELRARAKAFLSVGHDEYYSTAMYDNLKGAVEAWQDLPQKGLSVGFFCGGSLIGVVAIEKPPTNQDRGDRVMRRIGRFGPIDQWLLGGFPEIDEFTDRSFSDAGELMGARVVEPLVAVADWICTNTQGSLASRLYNGSGLADGDRLRSLVGHEFVGLPWGKPGLEVVAEGNLIEGTGSQTFSRYTATLFPGPKGNYIFNASTLWWPQWVNAQSPVPYPPGGEPRFAWAGHGIISPTPGDREKVERMTINLFDMFLE